MSDQYIDLYKEITDQYHPLPHTSHTVVEPGKQDVIIRSYYIQTNAVDRYYVQHMYVPDQHLKHPESLAENKLGRMISSTIYSAEHISVAVKPGVTDKQLSKRLKNTMSIKSQISTNTYLVHVNDRSPEQFDEDMYFLNNLRDIVEYAEPDYVTLPL